MLSNKKMALIRNEVSDYWQAVADLVDEKTTALLTVNHLTKYEHDSQGRKRSRSMGDVWLKDNGIYHPINVKTGIVGSEGQPNLVSLKKVLNAIMERQIDSYYLLIVKMQLNKEDEDIESSIYFLDMLDWLDYVTFDSGPGQMMLRAVKFFNEYDPNKIIKLDIRGKVQKLMNLYEDGEKRLRKNRERVLEKYKKKFSKFMTSKDFIITAETQRSINLQ